MTEKLYLGDAVFVHVTKHGDVVLTTHDGLSATNTIVLEPTVLQSFLDYLQDDMEVSLMSHEHGRIEAVVTKKDDPDL